MDDLTLGIRAFQKSLYNEAIEVLEPLANQGVLRAQKIMARLYYAGNGVEKDLERYTYWLQMAADNGDKAAKSQIKKFKKIEKIGAGEMVLTEQQKAYFETFGYLCLPGAFANEIADITRHFDDLFLNFEKDIVNWTHEVHNNKLRRFISSVTEKDDYIAGLVRGERINNIATAILGERYTFTGSDASIYDCGTNFHQDGAGIREHDATHVKMALYLDPVDALTGAIRVLPGTQYRDDKFTQLANKNLWLGKKKKLDLKTEEIPCVVVPSQPGDLIMWNYRVLHATLYGGNQRRMLALEFKQS